MGEFAILPLYRRQPVPDLEEWLAALHAMGPTKYEPGEQERISRALTDLEFRPLILSSSLYGAKGVLHSAGAPGPCGLVDLDGSGEGR